MSLKWMNQSSIYYRILWSFIMIIMIPLAVITFNTYLSVKESVTRQVRESNANVTDVIADQLSQTIDNISFASVYFSESKDPEIVESIRELSQLAGFASYDSYRSYSRLNQMASVLMVQSNAVDIKIFMLNRDNQVMMGNLQQRLFSKYEDAEFLRANKVDAGDPNKLQWFPVKSSESQSYYYAAKVIRDPRSRDHLATLYIGIPAAYFERLFSTIQSGSMVLYSGDGSVIARSGEGEVTGEQIRTEKNISRTGWRLVYDTPQSEATGLIAHEFRMSNLATWSFFLLFFLFSMYLARSISTPIHRLRNTAKQYVSGNRNVRMPVKGKDEMALLATVFNQMLDDINRLIEQVENEQEEKRVIELQALFSQIRPHFLLNSLNSIKVRLIMAGDETHSRLIASLTSMLRAYVRVHDPIMLKDECKLLEDYIELMQIRSKLNIDFDWRLSEAAAEITIPRLLLQPIIENAVIHGFALQPVDARIELNAEMAGDYLMITIADNGRGVSEEKLLQMNQRMSLGEEESGTEHNGVGLVNAARRVRLTYGAASEIKAYPGHGSGLLFVLRLPISSEKEGA